MDKQLDTPDIKLAGFSLWVHQRQLPEAEDFWDANWLIVTACCEALGAQVETRGPIVHLTEIETWLKECQQMHASLSGEACLNCMEPELDLILKMQTSGRLTMEVEITPNHLVQKHWFQFDIDQSYLPELIRDCQRVLEKYPLKHLQNQ